jgi:TolA-binding protein
MDKSGWRDLRRRQGRETPVSLRNTLFALLILSVLAGVVPGCKGASEKNGSGQERALSIPEYFQSLFRDDPESQKEFQRIQDEFRRGEQATAVRDLQELLSRSPGAPWAEAVRFYLAQASMLLRGYGEAIRQFDLLLERYPDSPAVPRFLMSKGQTCLAMGRQQTSLSARDPLGEEYLREAEEIFRKLSKEYRENAEIGAEALFCLGEVFASLREFAEARKAFRRAADDFPDHPFAGKSLFELANLHLSEPNLKRAERVFQEITERYPDTGLAEKARTKLDGLGLVGSQAPPLQVQEWIGEPPREPVTYGSRLTLLSFWSVWCPHCRRNIPKMERLREAYEKEGVSLIGVTRVAQGQGVDKIREYVDGHPMGYPTAVDEEGKTSKEMAVKNIPCVVAVDSQGRIRWHGHPDFLSDNVLQALLRTSP